MSIESLLRSDSSAVCVVLLNPSAKALVMAQVRALKFTVVELCAVELGDGLQPMFATVMCALERPSVAPKTVREFNSEIAKLGPVVLVVSRAESLRGTRQLAVLFDAVQAHVVLLSEQSPREYMPSQPGCIPKELYLRDELCESPAPDGVPAQLWSDVLKVCTQQCNDKDRLLEVAIECMRRQVGRDFGAIQLAFDRLSRPDLRHHERLGRRVEQRHQRALPPLVRCVCRVAACSVTRRELLTTGFLASRNGRALTQREWLRQVPHASEFPVDTLTSIERLLHTGMFERTKCGSYKCKCSLDQVEQMIGEKLPGLPATNRLHKRRQ
jgi:hypothetical protein